MRECLAQKIAIVQRYMLLEKQRNAMETEKKEPKKKTTRKKNMKQIEFSPNNIQTVMASNAEWCTT